MSVRMQFSTRRCGANWARRIPVTGRLRNRAGVNIRTIRTTNGMTGWSGRRVTCRGALLMPKSRVCRLAQKLVRDKGLKLPLEAGSPSSVYLVEHVVIAFHVSRDTATVRLKQLGLIG